MGKRSNFARVEKDFYPTPYEAVLPLLPHLHGVETFAEPCAGEGHLVGHLQRHGYVCAYEGDISYGYDAMTHRFEDEATFDAIISNFPWTREILHPLIVRCMKIAPTWIILDADWAHTTMDTRPGVQPKTPDLLNRCSHIVSVGKVRWIEGSKHKSLDNVSWYRFHAQHTGGPKFIGREVVDAR
ncbi:hypothetical protein [Rhizobium sp. BK196]|uniref:hypothetical protein n=1 Tax=Rhizobium sp. BK196 TaxID=2587073 RepID=UPI0016188668|nr:hypothetical protein [Rhizobium sp. BK196]